MARRISNRAVLLVLVGVLALAAGIYFGRGANFGSGGTKADGQALLGLSLPESQGREQAIAQWKGKVLIVNFWATWCVPCREEMPVREVAETPARAECSSSASPSMTRQVREFAAELQSTIRHSSAARGHRALEVAGQPRRGAAVHGDLGREGQVSPPNSVNQANGSELSSVNCCQIVDKWPQSIVNFQ
jgi:thiol-disulfide isomerase/thioredoxin